MSQASARKPKRKSESCDHIVACESTLHGTPHWIRQSTVMEVGYPIWVIEDRFNHCLDCGKRIPWKKIEGVGRCRKGIDRKLK